MGVGAVAAGTGADGGGDFEPGIGGIGEGGGVRRGAEGAGKAAVAAGGGSGEIGVDERGDRPHAALPRTLCYQRTCPMKENGTADGRGQTQMLNRLGLRLPSLDG